VYDLERIRREPPHSSPDSENGGNVIPPSNAVMPPPSAPNLGDRGAGKRRHKPRSMMNWKATIPSARAKVLCLGMSYASVVDQLKASGVDGESVMLNPMSGVERAVELVRRNVLTEMDGRDLARILSLEESDEYAAYTVSLERGSIYEEGRHMTANFNRGRFVRDLMCRWGNGRDSSKKESRKSGKSRGRVVRSIQFREVYLDYFWIPPGSWAMTHWKRSFFRDMLPDLAALGLLEEAGRVYLPFCLHCFKEVVSAKKVLLKHYTVTFLEKKNLHEHSLWRSTQRIDAKEMQYWLGKDLNQEEKYCTFSAKSVKDGSEDSHVSKDDLLDVYRRIRNVEQVRMIRLTALRKGEKGYFVGLEKKVKKKPDKEMLEDLDKKKLQIEKRIGTKLEKARQKEERVEKRKIKKKCIEIDEENSKLEKAAQKEKGVEKNKISKKCREIVEKSGSTAVMDGELPKNKRRKSIKEMEGDEEWTPKSKKEMNGDEEWTPWIEARETVAETEMMSMKNKNKLLQQGEMFLVKAPTKKESKKRKKDILKIENKRLKNESKTKRKKRSTKLVQQKQSIDKEGTSEKKKEKLKSPQKSKKRKRGVQKITDNKVKLMQGRKKKKIMRIERERLNLRGEKLDLTKEKRIETQVVKKNILDGLLMNDKTKVELVEGGENIKEDKVKVDDRILKLVKMELMMGSKIEQKGLELVLEEELDLLEVSRSSSTTIEEKSSGGKHEYMQNQMNPQGSADIPIPHNGILYLHEMKDLPMEKKILGSKSGKRKKNVGEVEYWEPDWESGSKPPLFYWFFKTKADRETTVKKHHLSLFEPPIIFNFRPRLWRNLRKE